MKTLNAPDTISGKEGRAYAKINGNNEELFYAKTIEANVEKSKSEIKAIGKRMTGHKTTGANGSGSMTLYYMTPLFREMLRQWKETGKDVYFDMVVENDDQESSSRASSESPSSFARTTESRLQSIRRTVCFPAEDSWSSFSTTISK